ncbi:hypothetical protein CPB86DRAFT_802047 [Serendipita vermifera]|nr:hypothetical protein CPB86DRAFT_802047 [Serendipita vermifera]
MQGVVNTISNDPNVFTEWLQMWSQSSLFENQTNLYKTLLGGTITHIGGFGASKEEDSDDLAFTMVLAPEESLSASPSAPTSDNSASAMPATLRDLSCVASPDSGAQAPLMNVPTKRSRSFSASTSDSEGSFSTMVTAPEEPLCGVEASGNLTSAMATTLGRLPYIKKPNSTTLFPTMTTVIEQLPLYSVLTSDPDNSIPTTITTPITNRESEDPESTSTLLTIVDAARILARSFGPFDSTNHYWRLISRAASHFQVYAGVLIRFFNSMSSVLLTYVKGLQPRHEQIVFVTFALLGFVGSLGWFRLINTREQQTVLLS